MGKTFLRKLCVAILCLTLPSLALAAGLGRLTVLSGLGQPLKAEIEVVALQPGEADTLAAALASVDTFRQANVEFTSALQSIRFVIERRANNRYVIALTSAQPMNEPFIDLLVELSWSAGRLVREYTFLLDPPELKPVVSAPIPAVVPPVAVPLDREAPKPAAAPAPATAADSGRAPVASPARTEKPAARPAASKGTYEVKRGDTLAKIASQNMVGGASLQQMLAALYRGNEEAFDNKNMNRLRTGRILNLPGAEDVQGISQSEATQLVRSQAADYAEFQRSIGAAVASAPARADSTRQAAGRITAPGTDKPAAKAPGQDQLRLSKPDDAKGGARSAAAASADDLAAKDKALREAKERIALLEKNVQDLQKLVQLKSGAGAQAQKQAEAAKPEAKPEAKASAPAAKAEAAKAAIEPAKPAADAAKAPAPAEAANAAAAATPAPGATTDPTKAAEAPKPAAEGSVAPDVAKAAPKPAPKAPPPPPPEPPSFVDELLDNDLALGGAGAVLVLLAGYAGYAWRRKKKAAAVDFGDGAIGGGSVAAAGYAAGTMASESMPVSEQPEAAVDAKAESEEIDPIAEADVYMAYGRDAQAEEILKEALSKDVNRVDVWTKLLEVYANRKDVKTFESTAMDVQTLTGGQGPDWEKVQAMGLELDPTNALYGGSGEPGGAVDIDMGSTQILPDMSDAIGDTTVVDEPEAAPAEGGSALDFDLDLGAAPAADADSGIDLDLGAETTDTPAEGEAGGGLDFDLGMGGDQPAETTPETDFTPQGTLIMDPEATVANVQAMEAIAEPAADAGASIDFDLDLGTPAVEAVPTLEEAPAEADSMATMDFDLSLGDTPAVPAETEAASTEAADIDLSAISLDLGTESATPPEAMDSRWQEVATKLDLAKAYEEMGDKDGARDLLNEVLQEGDAVQKQQAQTMINTLG